MLNSMMFPIPCAIAGGMRLSLFLNRRPNTIPAMNTKITSMIIRHVKCRMANINACRINACFQFICFSRLVISIPLKSNSSVNPTKISMYKVV